MRSSSFARRWRTAAIAVLLGTAALVLTVGTSVTAAELVTGRHIKDGSVTGRDLRDRAVAGADIRDGSLTPADYAGVVEGPRGPIGPTGPVGPQGPHGVRGVAYVVSPRLDVDPAKWHAALATCPEGSAAIAGGFATEGGPTGTRVVASHPLADGTAWLAAVANEGAASLSGYAWAVCALPG